jgi:hypothetical protein
MKYKVRHTPQVNKKVAAIAKALAPYPNMGKRILKAFAMVEWLVKRLRE